MCIPMTIINRKHYSGTCSYSKRHRKCVLQCDSSS